MVQRSNSGGGEIFLHLFRPAMGACLASCTVGAGSLFWGQSGWDVAFTTHPHLGQKLKSRAIPVLSLQSFMACYSVNLTFFIFTCINKKCWFMQGTESRISCLRRLRRNARIAWATLSTLVWTWLRLEMNLDRGQRMVCSWLQIMNAGVRSFWTELTLCQSNLKSYCMGRKAAFFSVGI